MSTKTYFCYCKHNVSVNNENNIITYFSYFKLCVVVIRF